MRKVDYICSTQFAKCRGKNLKSFKRNLLKCQTFLQLQWNLIAPIISKKRLIIIQFIIFNHLPTFSLTLFTFSLLNGNLIVNPLCKLFLRRGNNFGTWMNERHGYEWRRWRQKISILMLLWSKRTLRRCRVISSSTCVSCWKHENTIAILIRNVSLWAAFLFPLLPTRRTITVKFMNFWLSQMICFSPGRWGDRGWRAKVPAE